MAKINTYGLKMTGLKKASGSTQDYGFYSGLYDEIFYDLSTGEVWTKFQCSLGYNTWTVYNDAAIVKVGNTCKHLTMQQIADMIHDVVSGLEVA